MSRISPHTTRCTGCRRIYVNELWMRERREYHVKYRVSVCPQCIEVSGPRTQARSPMDLAPPRQPAKIGR